MGSRRLLLRVLILATLVTITLSPLVLAITSVQALVDIRNPFDGAQFVEGNVFNVTVDVTCSKDKCANTRVTIGPPPGLSLPNNDAVHSLGSINAGKVVKTSWRVSADAPGNYTITVASNSTTKSSQPHSDNVSIMVIPVNRPPVADAGPDQTLMDSDNDGFETVILNGSRSLDPDGVMVNYAWRDGGTMLGAGGVISVNLGVGVHNVTLTVIDDDGATGIDTAVVTVVPSPMEYFGNDVESGEDGWSATGLWHITGGRSNSPTHSWWYGNETTGTYQTFGEVVINGSVVEVPIRNFGDLISPPIDIRPATAPVLTFYNYWYTELGTTWDTKKVFISTDEGATWVEVFQQSANPMVWERITVDLSSFAGNMVRLRFSFDTVDGRQNNREGWFIDDVQVKQ